MPLLLRPCSPVGVKISGGLFRSQTVCAASTNSLQPFCLMWVDLQLRDLTPREGNENAEMGTVAPIKTSAHPWRAEAEGSRHEPIMSQKAEHFWGLRRIYYDVFLIAHRQTNSCNSTLNIAPLPADDLPWTQ